MIPQTKRHILFLRKKDVFIYYSGIKQYMVYVVLSPMLQHYFRKRKCKQKQEMALVSGLIQM